jgi:hypothetical protein
MKRNKSLEITKREYRFCLNKEREIHKEVLFKGDTIKRMPSPCYLSENFD